MPARTSGRRWARCSDQRLGTAPAHTHRDSDVMVARLTASLVVGRDQSTCRHLCPARRILCTSAGVGVVGEADPVRSATGGAPDLLWQAASGYTLVLHGFS